jgi:hypothetical protein
LDGTLNRTRRLGKRAEILSEGRPEEKGGCQ